MIKADSAGRNNLSGGNGFALPRLISRPQEGSGEEYGQVSDWGFLEIRRLITYKVSTTLFLNTLSYKVIINTPSKTVTTKVFSFKKGNIANSTIEGMRIE